MSLSFNIFSLRGGFRGILRWSTQGVSIGSILERDNNNFDLLRLVASSTVILGHGFALSNPRALLDPVQKVIRFDYSGGVAVSVFFFLSGLLVCDSLCRNTNVFQFFINRIARIYPGLLVCLTLSVLLVGAIFSVLPLGSYYADPETISYYTRNAGLTNLQWRLPGVFSASHFGLNGSLWTLPLEVRLYVVLMLIWGLGAYRNRWVGFGVICFFIIYGALFSSKVPYFFDRVENVRPVFSFFFGCALAFLKSSLRIYPLAILVGWGLVATCIDTPIGSPLFYIVLYLTCLILFSLRWVIRVRLPGDYSYGIYIYGFIIQQCVVTFQPYQSPYLNFIISLPIALCLAVLSWHLVEKPYMDKIRLISRQVRSPFSFVSNPFSQVIRRWRSLVTPAICLSPFIISFVFEYLTPKYHYLDVQIESFGPTEVKPGVVFNKQPNGLAAVWVKVDSSLSSSASIVLGGVRLQSAPNGTVVTALVPTSLYSTPGGLGLCVEDRLPSGELARCKEVVFSVK